MTHSKWSKIGRAACWGIAGIGAAAVRSFSGAVRSIIASFSFNAAAQLCTETFA